MASNQELSVSKSLKRDIFKIILFFLRMLGVSFVIAVILFIFLVLIPSPIITSSTFIDFGNFLGAVCVLVGFLIIVFTGSTNQTARMSVAYQAARYRTPDQNKLSNEFLRRYLEDWHRVMGGFLLLISGLVFLLSIYASIN